MYDTTIGSRFTNPRFKKLFGDHAMPETGDNVAKEFNVTREQADEFALASQKKYAKAEAEGFYKGEILESRYPARSATRRRQSSRRTSTRAATRPWSRSPS
jgi:acetyl-CoA C-acetyltransferase